MVNLTTTLITKLTANQASITLSQVFINLLPKTKHRTRQRVTSLLTITLNSLLHLIPVILHAHCLMNRLSIVVQLNTSIQHTRISNILRYVGIARMVITTRRTPVVKISNSTLVQLIVSVQPRQQHLHIRIRIQSIHLLTITRRQTANPHQSVILTATATTANNIDTPTSGKLFVVRGTHHTPIHQLTGTYAKRITVVFHN